MARSLRSIENQGLNLQVIAKRISSNTRGLGYWAAVDAHKELTGQDLGDYSKK